MNIQNSQTKWGSNFGHPRTGPHTSTTAGNRTSATPSLHSIDRCYLLCFDIAIEKLIFSLPLTDKSKPRWSEKCQVHGIMIVSASEGQGPAAYICYCLTVLGLASIFASYQRRIFLSHTFSQDFHIFFQVRTMFIFVVVCQDLILRPREDFLLESLFSKCQ